MSLDNALEMPIHALSILFVPPAEARRVMESFRHIPGIACTLALAQKPGFNDLLVTNSKATNEQAIAKLLEILGTTPENTIGIGDGHNDLHLFKAVGQKVAMGNAVEELKDAADLVIGSVSDDGLAKYLERLH